MNVFRQIGSPGFPRDEDDLRDLATRSFERGHDAAGPLRQLHAIVADRNRTQQLHRLRVPTTVIHGTADKLVRPSGGKATAKAIRGARLKLIEGMGHDMPRGVWPQLLDGIEHNAVRAAEREGLASPAR
jgi:pimeloyl-ACP methyl ester carboxylesterase